MFRPKFNPPQKKRTVPDWLGGSGFWDSSATSGNENGDDHLREGQFEFTEELVPVKWHNSELGKERRVIEYEEEEGSFKTQANENVRKERAGKEAAPPVPISVAEEAKLSDLEFELSRDVIRLDVLQRIAKSGIPDGGRLRATTWKILLGYLPVERDLWEAELAENRAKYAALKTELLLSPSELTRRLEEGSNSGRADVNNSTDGPLRRQEISDGDHPLNVGKASVWNKYFQYAEIEEQINRDLVRTHPEMSFFSGDSSFSHENREAMRSVLRLFAKMNPVISYVQGMNEVLAPLYYVFRTDSDEAIASNAEADSFACFVRLLSDSVDHFCQQLDNSSVGIHSTLSRLSELLKSYDEELWRHLVIVNKVNPQFFAFRWITLLLTQEFSFKTILRIWDSLLGDPSGVQDMLLRVCCAMLLCVRSKLLRGDFIANLKLLQHYPETDINYILEIADEIDTNL
ncbi:unnamed protein product [Victoria cruziana]